jgi:hypothetical protein
MSPGASPQGQMQVTITGNQISSSAGQDDDPFTPIVHTYEETYNVVRLGQLSGVYHPAATQFVNTVNMNFAWLISDNQFMGMPIIVGYGGCLPGDTVNEEAGLYLGALTVSGGVDWAANGSTGLPIGPRLITVENNQFFFVDGSFREGHIFASDKQLGVNRMYCGGFSNMSTIFPTLDANGALPGLTIGQLPKSAGALTGGEISSALIVQNNSALLGGAAGGHTTPQTVHSFTGSLMKFA